MTPRDPHRAVEAVWRIEAPRLIGALMRIVRDLDLAEEFAQDALVSALEQWPQTGVPDNPGAWLMTAARHRAIDRLRRHALMQRKHAELLHELEDGDADASARHEATLDDAIGDDLLRLIFTACHPVLSPEARAALTLRLLGGLTTEEIARAYLAPEPTVAQRIVRAKRTLAEAGVPYALQAAIAACHARAASTETTDWTRIAALYDALAQAMPSPVVELNRAVAYAMAFGPDAGLARVDALRDLPALRHYHLLPGVRGDLLFRLGRRAEARTEFERAAALARNAREHELLLRRAAACDAPTRAHDDA